MADSANAYHHLFGPVPSRRLGRSLGIDLVPFKTCSLNCIYCECGATTRLTIKRAAWVDIDAVKAELRHYAAGGPVPDTLTFSGSGEPTLHSDLGEMIAFSRQTLPDIPVALLTNGTLFDDPQVRQDAAQADIVLPSLDAATQSAFRAINRPHPKLDLQRIIDGLVAFREQYNGQIWLEIFILDGINNHPQDLQALATAVHRIRPDRVQLNSMHRPGTLPGLVAASPEVLAAAARALDYPAVELIGPSATPTATGDAPADLQNAVLELVRRRPCSIDDISRGLNAHPNAVRKTVFHLLDHNLLKSLQQDGQTLYCLSERR
ncbi:MAG TPA: radical SAM protein [bacterium]|nr:radical SAM protein [bacterium]